MKIFYTSPELFEIQSIHGDKIKKNNRPFRDILVNIIQGKINGILHGNSRFVPIFPHTVTAPLSLKEQIRDMMGNIDPDLRSIFSNGQ